MDLTAKALLHFIQNNFRSKQHLQQCPDPTLACVSGFSMSAALLQYPTDYSMKEKVQDLNSMHQSSDAIKQIEYEDVQQW